MGLDRVMTAGLMESIEWFFNLVSLSSPNRPQRASDDDQHDKNKDGYLTKDEVIQLSESLLVSVPSPRPLS